MVAGALQNLLEGWKTVANTQMSNGSRFYAACEQRVAKGIRFNVHILTPGIDHDLKEWESPLKDFLSGYGFDVEIERGAGFEDLSGSCFDEADLLIILPLSHDIESFCLEFAKEQYHASKMLVCVPEGDGDKIYCRALRESYGVETITMPVRKLVDGEDCRFGIDMLRYCADFLMEKVAASTRELRIKNTVVILVHGIRTRALWQGEIKNALEESGLIAIPTNYDKFDVLRFLLPFERFKRLPVKKVEDEVREAKNRFSDGHISLLAHSFGTYITGKLLLSTNYEFDRIAFCGSVLHGDFRFDSATGKFSQIVNEVGCRDIWPVLAAKLSWGYGPTGSFGFNRGNFVEDRKHANFSHSHFLNAEFCKQFWLPFFCDGTLNAKGDILAMPSRWVSFIDLLPSMLAKTMFWGVLLSLAFYAAWSVKWLVSIV